MNEQNTKKLFNKFKTFLKKKNLKAGFECSDGWYNILFDAFTGIANTDTPENFKVIKVFDHWGELKIHTIGGNCATRACIDEAIELADEVCQFCGNNKDLQQCDKCKDTDSGIGTYTPDIKAAVALPDKVELGDGSGVADDHAKWGLPTSPPDYYFKQGIDTTMVPPEDYFIITPKAYFDTKNCVYDSFMPGIEPVLTANGFFEMSECMFEYNGTATAGHALLLSLGFIENLNLP